MTLYRYDSDIFRQYREQAANVAEVRQRLTDITAYAKESGDLAPVHDVFHELTLRTEELTAVRASLGPQAVFLATYGVEILNDHTVSFVIPKGCSRLDLLEESQELARKHLIVHPAELASWRSDPRFVSRVGRSEKVCIDGHVQGLTAQSRGRQAELLAEKGLTAATLQDVAVAFAVFYIATEQPLFGWHDRSIHLTFWIRAHGGVLGFGEGGLDSCECDGDGGFPHVATAARIEPAR
jgi:hypothetical protein